MESQEKQAAAIWRTPSATREGRAMSPRMYIATEIQSLLKNPDFAEALAGFLYLMPPAGLVERLWTNA